VFILRDFSVNRPALRTNGTFLTLLQCSPLYEYTVYTQLLANRTLFIGGANHSWQSWWSQWITYTYHG